MKLGRITVFGFAPHSWQLESVRQFPSCSSFCFFAGANFREPLAVWQTVTDTYQPEYRPTIAPSSEVWKK